MEITALMRVARLVSSAFLRGRQALRDQRGSLISLVEFLSSSPRTNRDRCEIPAPWRLVDRATDDRGLVSHYFRFLRCINGTAQ